MRKLTIVFFDAGAGHRNAANAIKRAAELQEREWRIELLDFQELLGAIDPLKKFAHIQLQDGYNLLLRKGWTRFAPQMLVALQTAIRLSQRPIVHLLERHWRQHPADLVLSVIPNFNRALAESVRCALPQSPFVTLMTDLADFPPHFWIEPESQYVICGTQHAAGQAIDIGVRPENCYLVSGMVLNPRFYQVPTINRAEERQKLGLQANLPTALVLFGGQGSSVMLQIAEALQKSKAPVQMIFICGRNGKLADRIRHAGGPKPMYVEGFTEKMDYYMSIADFFIGKPGPGSISEALHFNLPVIVERNKKTLPQERYNADWIRTNQLGVVLESFREIEQAVSELQQNDTLDRFRTNAASHHNCAVFEAVDILTRLMPAESIGSAGHKS